jgi:hypothetical protein
MRFVATLLFALSLTADDFPLAPADRVPAAEAQSWPDVASNGSEFMAVWRDDRGGRVDGELYAARIRNDGTSIDETGIQLTRSPARPPQVAADGKDFVVAYTTQARSYFVRIEDGRLTERVLLPARRVHTVIDLETDGRTFGVLVGNGWTADAIFTDRFGRVEATVDLPAETTRLVAAGGAYWAVGADGTTPSSFLVRVTPRGAGPKIAAGSPSSHVAMVAGPDRFLVAWLLVRDESITIDYAVVDFDGNAIATARRSDHHDSAINFLTGPHLGWDGTQFLLWWGEVDARFARRTKAIRIAPDGSSPDQVPLPYPSAITALATAHHGGTTLMVTSENRGRYSNESDLTARALGSFPATLPAGTVVAHSASLQNRADVASVGPAALAVFTEGTWPKSLVCSLVAPNRAVKRIEVSPAEAATAKHGAVAGSRDQFLVAWFEINFGLRVLARRIGTDGELRDAAPIVLSPSQRYLGYDEPAVASDGSGFLVAWAAADGNYALYGATVRADGAAQKTIPLIPATDTVKKTVTVAWTGDLYVVLWREYVIHQPIVPATYKESLRMVRVTAGGVPLDPQPVILAEEFTRDLSSTHVHAASDGSGHTVATWATLECVRALALGRDGLPVGAARPVACEPGLDSWTETAAVWNGGGYTIFWTNGVWGRDNELRYAAVTPRLDVVREPRDLVRPGTGIYGAAAASTTDSVFLVYDKPADEGAYGGARRVFGRVLPKARF